MVLVSQKGVRLELETRGRLARFTLELSGFPKQERDGAVVSLRVFAELMASRFAQARSGLRS